MARSHQKIFHLTLHSNPKNIRKVERFLTKVSQHIALDEIQFHKLMVSLTEAVNNAIVHGNKSNPQRKVAILCELYDGGLWLRVRDQGRGFRPDEIESPLKEENLLRESGRGIFLMRTLMDRVEFFRTAEGMEVGLWLDLRK